MPGRIDLIPKMKYIEHRESNYHTEYVKELYTRHIEAFTIGTYTEQGNEWKNSIEKYISTFDMLIDDIKCNGIDENVSVIPVGKNNEIIEVTERENAIIDYVLKIKKDLE